MTRRAQAGITLVVSLIMLIVLTLLVLSAIRFGNINLRIAGNAQTQAESEAATQAAIEQTIVLVKTLPNVQDVPAQTLNLSTGGGTYTVAVPKPVCNITVNVDPTKLDPTKPGDAACFADDSRDKQFDANGLPIASPTECKDQNWEITANLDANSARGANMTMVQGVSMRVSSEVQCP